MNGIFFALVALFCWAFGDFITQKSIRGIGIWKTIFFGSIFGTVIFLPFAWNDLHLITDSPRNAILLFVMANIGIFSALFSFRAFKIGKLSIVEPIMGLELPLTVALGVFLWHDKINLVQLGLIAVVFVGIMMAISIKFKEFFKLKAYFEKGTFYALLAAIGLALANFFTGVSSNLLSPLSSFWFMHFYFLMVSVVILIHRGDFTEVIDSFKEHPKVITAAMLLNNIGWISFAIATTLIPISIATTISESYIVLAVLLGLFVNKERLKKHQLAGVLIVIMGVMLLSLMTAQ